MIEFLTEHPMYVVLSCTLVIWLGLAGYLWRLDNKLRNIETGKN